MNNAIDITIVRKTKAVVTNLEPSKKYSLHLENVEVLEPLFNGISSLVSTIKNEIFTSHNICLKLIL